MILEQFNPVLEAMQPGNRITFNTKIGANLIDVMPIFEKLPKHLHWWRKKGTDAFDRTNIRTYAIPW
jgi:hypothetical protein